MKKNPYNQMTLKVASEDKTILQQECAISIQQE